MTREEAIEMVRKSWPISRNIDLRKALETLIPELHESEDERIRKGLIEALKTSKTVGELKFILPEPTREECIAYLEKQKEQKHPNGCFTCDEYKKGYEAGRSNGFTAGYNKAMKEQKPAEWSVEDEHNLNSVISLVHSTSDGAWGSCIGDRIENWLKSLRPSWKPSEEQMDRLFSIIAALRKDYCDDMADFLANLRTDLKKLGVKEEPEYYQHFDPDC